MPRTDFRSMTIPHTTLDNGDARCLRARVFRGRQLVSLGDGGNCSKSDDSSDADCGRSSYFTLFHVSP